MKNTAPIGAVFSCMQFKFQFTALMREMQNAELRMQNCGIFFENIIY